MVYQIFKNFTSKKRVEQSNSLEIRSSSPPTDLSRAVKADEIVVEPSQPLCSTIQK